MKRILLVTLLLALVAYSSGCASMAVYKQSDRKIATRQARLSGDQDAIRATQLGVGCVGIGVDVTAWDKLTEQPLKQFGAAALDAALLYGAYELLQGLDISYDSDSSSRSKNNEINITDVDGNVDININDRNNQHDFDNSTDNSSRSKTTTNP